MPETDKKGPDGKNRRAWRRYELSGEGTLSLPSPGGAPASVSVTCVDQGAGGLSVRSHSPAAVGQTGAVWFPPGFRRRIEVVRCEMLQPTVMSPPQSPDGGPPHVVSNALYGLGLKFMA